MNSALKKLWRERVPDRDLDGFQANSGSARHSGKIVDDSTIIDDIVTIGQSMGLEVDADDVEELLEDHSIELTTEELKHLQNNNNNYNAYFYVLFLLRAHSPFIYKMV